MNMNKEEVEQLLQEKLEDGEHISPVLPEGVKNYLIDIDGTICDDIPNAVSYTHLRAHET